MAPPPRAAGAGPALREIATGVSTCQATYMTRSGLSSWPVGTLVPSLFAKWSY